MKVKELADELGLTSKTLLLMLKKMGHTEIKSANSKLSDDIVEKIRSHYENVKSKVKKEEDKKVPKTVSHKKEVKEEKVDDKNKEQEKLEEKKKDTQKKSKLTKEKAPKKVARTKTSQKSKPEKVVKEEIKKKEEVEEKSKKVIKEKKEKVQKISKDEIDKAIKKVISQTPRKTRKKKKVKNTEQEVSEDNVIKIPETISVEELAKLLGVQPIEIVKKCFELGLMVTINQKINFEIAEMVADEFGYKVELFDEIKEEIEEKEEEEIEEDESNLQPRHPIVTIMGHVDHGKTTLLDYIRKSNITKHEAGGITQHIGAYEVTTPHGKITFIDTPGHEAFTAMRARGANVTDIVILIVAADAGVMPQTVEAINHAKAAGVPIVVAINKVDLPEANPEKVKGQLAEHGIVVEDWGGEYQVAEISAKTGLGVDELLEKVLLEAEMLELKANPNRKALGVILESELSKGMGPVATVLVQQGTLRVGDPFVAGHTYGKVRSMINDRGQRVKEAGPSTPVRVIGFDEVPNAGDKFKVVESEKEAREIAEKRKELLKEKERQIAIKGTTMKLEDLYSKVQEGETQVLNIILKGDVDGSIEAIADSLMKLSTDEVKINVIHKAVGEIKESDVLLASASGAIIIGFNVRPNSKARELAKTEGVEIRTYKIIYEIIDDIKKAIKGLLKPEYKEEVIGEAEVREIFKISKVGTVAGCYVKNGVIKRNAKVRLVRDGIVMFDGELGSLKRFKEDVREVKEGYECGLTLKGYDDIKVGDIIECYEIVEVERNIDL